MNRRCSRREILKNCLNVFTGLIQREPRKKVVTELDFPWQEQLQMLMAEVLQPK